MTIALSALVLAAPAVAAVSALLIRDPRHAARVTASVLATAAGAALLLVAATTVGTHSSGAGIPVVVGDVPLTVGVRIDRFGALFVLLVCGIAAVVSAYARRYLDGDPEAARFQARVAAATAATLLMATAPNLIQLAIGWIVAGRILIGMVGYHGTRERVRRNVRRLRRLFLVGDLALLAGLVALAAAVRAVDLVPIRAAVAGAPRGLLAVSGLLLLVAGMVRSAQVPLHGWLPSTLDAPTPVSAFLHAGMVNVAGFLLIVFSPVFVAVPHLMAVVLLVGLMTAVAGMLFGAVRTDVKGALARSTVAQMGFMLAQCGIGAFGLAAVHLVGHGVYKAYAFLSAGGAVRAHLRAAEAPQPVGPPPARRLVPAVGVLLAVVALTELFLGASGGGLLSAVLVAAAGTAALAAALTDRLLARGHTAALAAVIIAACGAYLLSGRMVDSWLRLPSAASPATVGVAAVVLTALAVMARILIRRPSPRLWWWAWRDGYSDRRWRAVANRKLLAVTTTPPPIPSRVPAGKAGEADAAVAVAAAASAADLVGQAWPVDTFVAVNPLSGLERLPFAEATSRLRAATGARTHLPAEQHRRRLRDGDIEDLDLTAALADTGPATAALLPHGRLVTGADLRRMILLRPVHDGPQPPAPLLAAARRRLLASPAGWSGPDGDAARYTVPTLTERLDQVLDSRLTDEVDDLLTSWCAAYCGRPAARWALPGDDGEACWPRWRRVAAGDVVPELLGAVRFGGFVAALPARPERALAGLLHRLGVPQKQWAAYLSRALVRTPGWAGYAQWWLTAPTGRPGMTVVDLLAIRLAYEVAIGDGIARERLGVPGRIDAIEVPGTVEEPDRLDEAVPLARLAAELELSPGDLDTLAEPTLSALRAAVTGLSPQRQAEVWLAAAEHAYRRRLRDQLDRSPETRADAPGGGHGPIASDGEPPLAQALFCIDVRSEGLRRHLEASGPVETLGFAGFFGLPVRTVSPDAAAGRDRCPVLMRPVATVTGPAPEPSRAVRGRLRQSWRQAVVAAKSDPVGAFAFVELAGIVAAGALLVRAITPTRFADTPADTAPTAGALAQVLTRDERVFYAEATLRAMGLTDRFAPLLLLCGHGGSSVNNPYAAALDCGACGGNRGGVSARMVAGLLNDPDVRAGLAERGVRIPDGTHVLAAEHDTVTDEVRLYDTDSVPASHYGAVAQLSRLLGEASARLRHERAARLPGHPRAEQVPARATDWAQVRPEWALAGNAAFIAAPRTLTAGLDLGCRAFLHSYDWSTDPDGANLETIMTGPLVVAQWINMQYYFTSVDPDRFSAGNKTVHTVLGDGLGVLSGSGGDLCTGLPWQSVNDGSKLVHEPLRLLSVVQAPYPTVAAVLRRNPALRDLIDGGWLYLMTVDPSTGAWWEPDGRGNWREVSAPATVTEPAPGTAHEPASV
ncbi:putative inorganic carbon transporter subunit DabA [Micromonospora chalcea]|uniref:putative inorganic carbon transporter subunit DabA n=1 Tax=Micromonospora chalcea TaxID=1874 RepID=UPI003815E143